MKREFLKGLGVPEEAISKIMEENGNDVESAKKPLQAKIDSLTAQNTELTTKLDGYKDYDDLAKYKADSVAKEEKQNKIDYLKSIGCKHPDLFVDKVDFTKGKFNAEKKTYEGLDESVKGLKEQYAEMFESNDNPNPTSGSNDVTLSALGDGKGNNQSNFNQEFRNAFGIK